MKSKISLAILLSLFISATSFASFTDVTSSHINSDAIDYVESMGIVQGYPDGTYKPDSQINRAEFTKIVIASKYSQEDIDACNTSKFKDVGDGAWFTPYICLAELDGIISGYPDGTFQPANLINFAEASKIITNTLIGETPVGSQVWYELYVTKLARINAIPTTITGFDHQVTRGEMAEMIWRIKENITTMDSLTYEDLVDRAPTQVTFDLNTTNYSYSQTELTVKQGDVVTIHLTNDLGTHNFIIDELDVASITINSGQSTQVTFTATQKGTYEYYCSVGNHRELGMVGTLIVE